jgi:hypothetical protein
MSQAADFLSVVARLGYLLLLALVPPMLYAFLEAVGG